jgi:hypothetical protein
MAFKDLAKWCGTKLPLFNPQADILFAVSKYSANDVKYQQPGLEAKAI